MSERERNVPFLTPPLLSSRPPSLNERRRSSPRAACGDEIHPRASLKAFLKGTFRSLALASLKAFLKAFLQGTFRSPSRLAAFARFT